MTEGGSLLNILLSPSHPTCSREAPSGLHGELASSEATHVTNKSTNTQSVATIGKTRIQLIKEEKPLERSAQRATYPRNCAPEGPISISRLANPSPSTMGGGLASLAFFTKRQVMRVGAVHLRGGMMILMPWWRLPRMEPPRASTIKLTRKLEEERAASGKAGMEQKISNTNLMH